MCLQESNYLLCLGIICYVIICLNAANVEFIARENEYFGISPIHKATLNKMECCTNCGLDENCLAANYDSETSECELLAQKPQIREQFAPRQKSILFIKSDDSVKEWVRYGQSDYLLVETEMDWAHADGHCLTLNAELVDIHSSAENGFVANQFAWDDSMFIPLPRSIWIGLTDIEEENTFRWSSGTSLTYTGWFSGFAFNHASDDCVRLIELVWYVKPCDNARKFVCEKLN